MHLSPLSSITRITGLFSRGASRTAITPYRDWKAMLASFVFLFLLIIGIHFYIFIQVNNEELFQATVEEEYAKTQLDIDRLQDTLAVFEEKQQQFDALQKESPQVTSPSF